MNAWSLAKTPKPVIDGQHVRGKRVRRPAPEDVGRAEEALAIARREIDMRKVERGGGLVDFEFRMHREPVQKTHTLEDIA